MTAGGGWHGVFRRMTGSLVVAALSVSYFSYVFQLAQGTWLRSGLGDWMDPYFINALLEHWYVSARHLADPASPPMFFPIRGTLGYSHGLVLYAPFYILVRPWLHPFSAYTLSLFLVMEIGSLCLFAVFRRFMALGFIESLLLTAMFCTSGNVINGYSGIWSQSASVFLIPPILLLGLTSHGLSTGRLRTLTAGLAGLLAALLFTQDFYTAFLSSVLSALLWIGARWLLGLTNLGVHVQAVAAHHRPSYGRRRTVAARVALIVCGLGLVWLWMTIYEIGSQHHHWERPGAVAFAALIAFVMLRGGIGSWVTVSWPRPSAFVRTLAAGAALGIALFLWIYLRPALEFDRFPEEQLMGSIFPRDLSNWRHPWDLVRQLFVYDSARSFALVFLVAALAWMPWFRAGWRARRGAAWLLVVAVFVALVAVRINGFSLWTALFGTGSVPGFAAIRDPKRLIFPFELVAALGLGLFLAELSRRSSLRIGITILLAAFLVLDRNANTFAYRRSMVPFDRYVESPIAIDPQCRSFFMKRAPSDYVSRTEGPWPLYGIDALFIANRSGIPTLNGYSAWTPAEWWDLNSPQNDEYMAGVARWVRLQHLEHVCALDLVARTMTPYEPGMAR